MKHKFKITFTATILYLFAGAQAPYWKLGGNPGPGGFSPDRVNNTNNFMGTTFANSTTLRMGVNGSTDIFVDNDPLQLFIAPPSSGATLQGGHWVGLGRIFQPSTGPGASPFFSPKAHLHIHGGNYSGLFGFSGSIRPWFNTGTLYTENSDGMYVGLRNIRDNQSYAIINWGDDGLGGLGTDFLSFNFTGSGGALGGTIDGMELARISPKGAGGTFGIGNFQVYGVLTEPVRRLEVLDANPGTGLGSNLPQFRITYNYNPNPLLGTFTEFQTTFSGNMYFNTRNSTAPGRFGFHNSNPANVVEITTLPGGGALGNGAVGFPGGGSSGLRLTNVRAGTTPAATNPGPGLLSVDGNGDVIYVKAAPTTTANNGLTVNSGTIVQLGGPLPLGAAAVLLNNRYIPMSGFRLFMHGNGLTDGLTIGSSSGAGLPLAKLQVQSNEGALGAPIGIYGESVNTNGFSNIGIYGVGKGTSAFANYGVVGASSDAVNCIAVKGAAGPTSAPSAACIGVVGEASFVEAAAHIGVAGNGSNSTLINLGGEYYGLSSNVVSQNYGLYSLASGGKSSWGLMAKAFNAPNACNAVEGEIDGGLNYFNFPGSQNRAIYGRTTILGYTSSSGGGLVDNYAGFFDGDVFITGIGMSTGGTFTSDAMFKTSVDSINNALSIIKRLRPKSYYMDTTNIYGLGFSNKKQYGFIAQDVDTVLPELVSTINKSAVLDSAGSIVKPAVSFKALNYNAFSAIIMKGMQEQQKQIDSLKATAPSTAALTAQNGLNTLAGPNKVELGGTLLHNTAINQNSLDVAYYNGGKFTIGNSVPYGATDYKLQVYNDNADENASIIHNRPAASYTTTQIGLNVINGTSNSGASATNVGAAITVNGATSNYGLAINVPTSYSSGNTAIGVTGVVSQADNAFGANFGATGNASSTAAKGVVSLAYNGNTATGLESYASNGNNQTYGVYSNAGNTTGTGAAYGGYFTGSGAATNFGIYAGANGPAGTTYAGYFNGDVVRTGNDNFTSDATLKQHIDTITDAMGIIKKLKPKTFDYKISSYPSMNLPTGKQYGLLAQDVATVVPELVNTIKHPAKMDSLGAVVTPSVSYLGLEYTQLIPIMIKAMQTQQRQLEKQDSLIKVLTNNLNSCCENNHGNNGNHNGHKTKLDEQDVDLSDKDIIVLEQNVPNPFAEQTTIRYNIPANITKAQLVFYNSTGVIIQTVDIKTRGRGKVNVFASDLSSGLYNYTLIADGKVIDSKKMVRE